MSACATCIDYPLRDAAAGDGSAMCPWFERDMRWDAPACPLYNRDKAGMYERKPLIVKLMEKEKN